MTEPLVVFTGVFGVGKSSVVAEMADALERRDVHYAALDLDWLSWAWPGPDEDGLGRAPPDARAPRPRGRQPAPSGQRPIPRSPMPSRPLGSDDIRSTMAMPIRLVELRAPLELIRQRAAPDPTAGRLDDLRRTDEWLAEDADGRIARPLGGPRRCQRPADRGGGCRGPSTGSGR